MEATLEINSIVNENLEEEIYIIPKKDTKYHDETKIKLKQLLDCSRSNKIHTETVNNTTFLLPYLETISL